MDSQEHGIRVHRGDGKSPKKEKNPTTWADVANNAVIAAWSLGVFAVIVWIFK